MFQPKIRVATKPKKTDWHKGGKFVILPFMLPNFKVILGCVWRWTYRHSLNWWAFASNTVYIYISIKKILKLIYGLETVHSTQAMLNKISAFQLRGLRSILNLEPTFVNRRNTNEFVLRMASEKAGHEVKLFSELLLDKRVKLSGHLLRATDSDPTRQVVYSPQSANAFPIGKRRVGAPRQQWRHFTHKHIWNKLTNGWTDYLNTDEQNRRIHQTALARQF